MNDVIYPFVAGLFLGIILFGILEIIGLKTPFLRRKFYGDPADIPTLIYGYHLHHSVLGLISIGWGFYLMFNKTGNPFFWIGLGIGIIIVHTVVDGKVIFIEKVK